MPIYLKFYKISQKMYWTYTTFKAKNSWAAYYLLVNVFKGSINVLKEIVCGGGKYNLCFMVTDKNGFCKKKK